MKTALLLSIDTASLSTLEDSCIHALWHVSQLNPAPLGDKDAGTLVAALTFEILTRWLRSAPTEMHAHTVRDHDRATLQHHGNWRGPGGEFAATGATTNVATTEWD